MSLATRCPACGTVFRVVRDQLRVSEGWVRCGHCQEVFNALESLFELGPEAAPNPPVEFPPRSVGSAAPSTAQTRSAPLAPELDLSDPGDPGDPGDNTPLPPAEALLSSPLAQATGAEAPAPAWHYPPVAPPADSSPSGVGDPPVTPYTSSPVDPEPPAPQAPDADRADSASAPSLEVAGEAERPAAPAASFDATISVSSLLYRPDPQPVAEPAPPPSPDTADAQLPWPVDPAPTSAPVPIEPWPSSTDAAGPAEDAHPFDEALAMQALADTPSTTAPPPPDGPVGPAGPAAPDEAPTGHEDPASTPSEWQASQAGVGPVATEPAREWQRKRPRKQRTPPADSTGPDTGASGITRPRRAKPSFVRRAELDAHWQRPAVRAVLAVTAVVLALLLLGQATAQYRDGIAARWPALQPALAQACAALGCQLSAPRALDRISLDGSKLTASDNAGASAKGNANANASPDGRGSPAGASGPSSGNRSKWLRFSAELHNSARHSVRAPALELSFTDSMGQLVARRVLLPDELGLASGAIPADGLWRVDTQLDVGELRVAGFSVEVFYP